ncbi:PA domain-containing protein [Desulfobotulus alkaliphilus]|uniref:PA domain-containing protein n=1 Tax=Desulfobotulus alkaliphilus TaxID=622671 RepID=A0A562R4F6_9BACT|nr:S8 family serine peptidase [Desulfobotulus alkaliphilus]TWI63939.1 PA domain-containing protein [Desulfobotulus alkaliphilus]
MAKKIIWDNSVRVLACLILWAIFLFPAIVRADSHRLIVELEDAPLARWGSQNPGVMSKGRLNFQQAETRSYLSAINARQDKVLTSMRTAVSGVRMATFRDEENRMREHRYSVLFNGFTIETNGEDINTVRERLKKVPGVKAVHPVKSYSPSMYKSLDLINAPALWQDPVIGGRLKAGKGIRVASMDTGVHRDAPMFDPAGFSYPADYPDGGLGLKANNNGKIIASRVYYRPGDPPAAGDLDPWPGSEGGSHGVHTAGTAVGNVVQADFFGSTFEISGVAPAAWVMSYKVFYQSMEGLSTFETPEGIAALEDMVRDGADVVNCSWGEGPFSTGGEYDPMDTALLNAWRAGLFVVMAAGNSGPYKGTTDYPSEEYISVAASTTGGSIVVGTIAIAGPLPVPEEDLKLEAGISDYGNVPSLGSRSRYFFKTAASVAPDNVTACEPFEGKPFEGLATVVKRGGCNFDDKVLNAHRAGADFVVIYNNNGENIFNLSCYMENCDEIGTFAVFTGESHGKTLESWYDRHKENSELVFDFTPYQLGNSPDEVAKFSSRGPGVGYTLKPDIMAPGVNILSQGYGPLAEGEERHLSFGQISGTSMAAPHIAGAAALLKQRYPLWSNGDIKSALMSTAKFMDIYTHDGKPAQPLDMGAGRVNLAKAVDPGVILTPPSLGFGIVEKTGEKTRSLSLRSILPEEKTYHVSTIYTGDGFDAVRPLDGFHVEPLSVTLPAFGTAAINVRFDGQGAAGDHQGYVLLESDTHRVHFPVWARVQEARGSGKKILLLDMDGSSFDENLEDYRRYYINALNSLEKTYDVLDVNPDAEGLQLPEAAVLAAYEAVLLFSGDSREETLVRGDLDRLMEYVNGGGLVIAMGQNMFSSVLSASSSFYTRFQVEVISDSLTEGHLPELPVIASEDVPPAFRGIFLDLREGGDGAANQRNMDAFSEGIVRYPGRTAAGNGYLVQVAKDLLTLEKPALIHPGIMVASSMGLEGINNDTGAMSREFFLRGIFSWALDQSDITIRDISGDYENHMEMSRFDLAYSSDTEGVEPVSVRWDMGDGKEYQGPYGSPMIGYVYEKCGPYTLRAEVVDSLGNHTIGSLDVNITRCLDKEEKPAPGSSSGSSSGCFIRELVAGF